MALDSHIGPRAKALGPIWLPQCQYDLEAHLGRIITCKYVIKIFVWSIFERRIKTGFAVQYKLPKNIARQEKQMTKVMTGRLTD